MYHAPLSAPPAKLAPYACTESGPRVHDSDLKLSSEKEFLRDFERVQKTAAYKRLAGKTQVFSSTPDSSGVFFNRQKHSDIVAAIAVEIAEALHVNTTLAETVGLAHDFGHTPFGHVGEYALQDIIKEKGYGFFDHNEAAFRILTRIEPGYNQKSDLNLSQATLEAIVKHNGPLVGKSKHPLPPTIKSFCEWHDIDLHLDKQACLEGQVAALADDAAYMGHDFRDAFLRRCKNGHRFFEMAELRRLPIMMEAFAEAEDMHGGLQGEGLVKAVTRQARTIMTRDIIQESKRRLLRLSPQSCADIQDASGPVVGFSATMERDVERLKTLFRERLWNHKEVKQERYEQMDIVAHLFCGLMDDTSNLPLAWTGSMPNDGAEAVRHIVDYICTLTDQQAVKLHNEIYACPEALKKLNFLPRPSETYVSPYHRPNYNFALAA